MGVEDGPWRTRCAALAPLRHPCVARLLDYGPIGAATRFEAWRASRAWTGNARLAAEVLRRAEGQLRAAGVPAAESALFEWAGLPALVPSISSMSADRNDHEPLERQADLASCGVETLARPAVDAIAELLGDPSRREPSAIALWGEPGSGRRVAIETLARIATQRGVVPITAAIDDEAVWTAVAERSLLIIADITSSDATRDSVAGAQAGWRRLLSAGLARKGANLLVIVSAREVPGVANLRLDPLTPDELAGAVRPCDVARIHEAAIRRLSERAKGRPGCFTAALASAGACRRTVPAGPASRVAEPVPAYGQSALARSPPARRPWPVSAATGRLRQRLDAGLQALDQGRHVSAERSVRAAVGALTRRREFHAATRGWLALARSRLRRGHAAGARAALEEARILAERGEDDEALLDVTVMAGVAALDGGAPAAAECVLRGALATARARGECDRLTLVRGALSRVLFWQGRFDEAAEHAEFQNGEGLSDEHVITLGAAAARAAVGLRAFDVALRCAARATEAAGRLGDHAGIARAACATAFVHLVVDDRGSVAREVGRCLAAARAARDPLRALRARLLLAEVDRRSGRADRARRLLVRLQRLPGRALPAPVQVRVALLQELMNGSDGHRLGAATGLRAVELFARRAQSSPVTGTADLADLIELLTGAQDATDERAALASICACVRARLRAAAVAVVVQEGADMSTVAVDGSRTDPTFARRALEVGQPVRLVAPSGGAAAAAPIRYGGRLAGAIVARWSAGVDVGPERSTSLLVLAALVAGPALVAVVARATQVPAQADEIIGTSPAITAVREAVGRAARAPYPVLVEGESGCGKELVARALHRRSPRRERAFRVVNCAALPDDLVEAELFGHARGAFTGAAADRPGVFEDANGGTLFLDEIGELSLRAQAKLLRAVQEGEVRRLGENAPRRVDVRLVAATNRDLRQEVALGRFRHDLLYRLDVVRITVPPLRDRPEDVVLLAERFWREATARVQSVAVLSAETLAALSQHRWPGNVRELQNVIAVLVVAAPRRGVIRPSALPESMRAVVGETSRTSGPAGTLIAARTPDERTIPDAASRLSLAEARRAFDRQFVGTALARAGGHRGRAARTLGLSRQGLAKLLLRCGMVDL